MADAARTPFPAFLPALFPPKYVLDYCTYVQYSQASFPSHLYPRSCMDGACMAPAVATYEPRDPSRTVLYTVIADHLETFLAALNAGSCTRALRIIPLPLKPATMLRLTILERGQGHGFTPFLRLCRKS